MRSLLERKRVAPEAIDTRSPELERRGVPRRRPLRAAVHRGQAGLDRWGAERIERELQRRGSAAIVETAVAGTDRDAELEAALALLAERVAPPEDDRERDHAWRMLMRKGYAPELAYDAVRAHGAPRRHVGRLDRDTLVRRPQLPRGCNAHFVCCA